jgi:hypothetical protein
MFIDRKVVRRRAQEKGRAFPPGLFDRRTADLPVAAIIAAMIAVGAAVITAMPVGPTIISAIIAAIDDRRRGVVAAAIIGRIITAVIGRAADADRHEGPCRGRGGDDRAARERRGGGEGDGDDTHDDTSRFVTAFHR